MTSTERDLGEVFVILADSLKADHDIIDTMDLLVEAATTFTSAIEAGIVLADPDGNLHIVASTSERTSDVEEEQLGTREGPCLDAFHSGDAVDVSDISATAEKWPHFVESSARSGFKAAHAVPLRLRTQILGSMNLFSTNVGALSDADAALVQALTDVATIGIIHQRADREHADVNQQLQHALESRIIIEQAKGFLAERHQLPIDGAFQLLRQHARSNHARLRDIALQVTTRQLSI